MLCRAQISRFRIPAPCSSRVWSSNRVGTLSFLLRAGGRLYRNGRSIFAGAPPRPSTRLGLILAVLSRVACVFTPSSFLARTPQSVGCFFFKFDFFRFYGHLPRQINFPDRTKTSRAYLVRSKFFKEPLWSLCFCVFVDYSSKKLLLSFSPAEATLFLVWILFAVGNTPYGKWHSSRAEPPL